MTAQKKIIILKFVFSFIRKSVLKQKLGFLNFNKVTNSIIKSKIWSIIYNSVLLIFYVKTIAQQLCPKLGITRHQRNDQTKSKKNLVSDKRQFPKFKFAKFDNLSVPRTRFVMSKIGILINLYDWLSS